MTEFAEPFDGGPDMFEKGWSNLWSTTLSNGVINRSSNGLRVYTEVDGRQVKVTPGQAHIRGHIYTLDTIKIIPISFNGSGFTRLDNVVLRLDVAQRKMTIELLTGTPAAAPTLPLITQLPGGIWEMPLADVTAPNLFGTIDPTNIKDRRVRVGSSDLWTSYTPVTFQSKTNGVGDPIPSYFNITTARYKVNGDACTVFCDYTVALSPGLGPAPAYGITLPLAPRYANSGGVARIENVGAICYTALASVDYPAPGGVILERSDHADLNTTQTQFREHFNITYEIAPGA